MRTARVYDISPAIARRRQQDAIDKRIRMEVSAVRRQLRRKRIAVKIGKVALVLAAIAVGVKVSLVLAAWAS